MRKNFKSKFEYARKKRPLDIFTPFRGIMIIFIMLFHIFADNIIASERNFLGFTNNSFFISKGYVGVEFFFLLSTFVFLYQNHNTNLLTFKSYFSFQKKKIIRIYPLHIITVFFFIISHYSIYDIQQCLNFSKPLLFGHLTLTHAWGVFNTVGFNYPSWYLSAQFFLYLMMPFFLFLYHRSKLLICFLLLYFFIIFGYITFQFNTINHITQYAILRGITSMFFAGIAFWIYQILIHKNIKANSIFIISILLFIGYLTIQYLSPLLVPDVIIIPIFTSMIVGLLFITDSIKEFFMKKWLVFIGNISFPLKYFLPSLNF